MHNEEYITTNLSPDLKCLYCGRQTDSATGMDPGTIPKPGDVTVCAYCGEVLVITGDLRYRKPTPEELTRIVKEPISMHVMYVWPHDRVPLSIRL